MGTAPGRCVVVEDSPFGIEAARAAGMRSLGFAATTPPDRLADADAVFGSMADPADLISR
jgi:beta-phosphoglucomutase-like phosphatase (HAD superfamily)